jgi:hypothetical protein
MSAMPLKVEVKSGYWHHPILQLTLRALATKCFVMPAPGVGDDGA